MTDIPTPSAASALTSRLVDVFATAGAEADGQGVLPDALAELGDRLGGEDTTVGTILHAVADILEAAGPP